MELSLSAFGDEIVSRKLHRFADNAEDMRPAFTQIIDLFHEIEEEQFDLEGGRFGSERWEPLNPIYAEQKRRRLSQLNFGSRGHLILEFSGVMRESLTGKNLDAVVKISRDEMFVGTSDPKARFHQKGTVRGLPARPVVKLNENDKRAMVKIVQRHLVESERGAGEETGFAGLLGRAA